MTIASPEVEKLASEVAKETGETPAQAVIRALEERLARLRRGRDAAKTLQVIMEISQRCGALPDLEKRSPDEIIGYNEMGVPD
jgi:antitoxin VapB